MSLQNKSLIANKAVLIFYLLLVPGMNAVREYPQRDTRGRSSLIHFSCIGIAPPRLFMPRREQSRGSNSVAGKIDQI